MSTARTFTDVLLEPSRGLAAAAARRSALPPILAATAASLLLALALVPRLDLASGAEAALDAAPQEEAPSSPHERQVKIDQARKLGTVMAYGGALFGPALSALGAAAALFLAIRLAGARAPFRPTLAVAAWGLLPLAARDLLTVPAALARASVAPEHAATLLPSSLAALLPAAAPPRLAAALAGLDLFALWAVALVATGLAIVAAVSRRRALAVVAVLWLCLLLLTRVALPGFAGP